MILNNNNISELNNRKFDNCLISIIVIPIKIYFKESEDLVNEKELYLFFSCNIQGKRKYLTSVFKDNYTKTSDWYDFMQSFKSKGINVVIYALIPNNEYLSKALKLAFNDIFVFISYIETITKLSKYYTSSYTNSIFNEVRKIYLAKDINEYEVNLVSFKEEYLNFPFIIDLFESDLKRAKQYYGVSYELRRFIFSFYFSRDLYKRLIVISHSKTYFTSVDEFISLLIPDIQRFELRMFCPKNELNNIINILYNDKKELIKDYL